MAQNVTIAGASYSDVPAINVPKTGGGTAIFSDPSVTTAVAADVASGKFFLAADGTLTAGTGSSSTVVVTEEPDIAGGIIKNITVTGSMVSLQAKSNITPTTSSQTIVPDAGYDAMTSVQINAIPSQYHDTSSVTAAAGDVVSGKVIVDSSGTAVNGSLVIQHYYTGSGAPSSSTGVDGDIYLQTS